MAVLASDLVSNCPNFEQSKLEFGSYRWNPTNNEGNTEGSLIDPVTTDSVEDEIEISHADALFFDKDESIVYARSNAEERENVKKKLCSSKATSSTVRQNLQALLMRLKT